MAATAVLERYYSSKRGTLGKLRLPCGFTCMTIERPWRQNKPFVSCIPAGEYPLEMRPSDVVSRTTAGEFTEGYEVTGVDNRSLIMIHPGNSMYDLLGCIAPGEQASQWGHEVQKRIPAAAGLVDTVTNSRQVFRELMSAMEDRPAKKIRISWCMSPEV